MTITTLRASGTRRTPTFWSRHSLNLCALALSFQCVSQGALAGDALDRLIKFDIPANTRLEDALIEWGTITGMTVMISTPTVDHQLTKGIRGTLNARDALSALLQKSGLSYKEEGGKILVVETDALLRSGFGNGASGSTLPSSSDFETSMAEPSANSSRDSDESSTTDSQSPTRKNTLEEVVVTAQKREERLQDVPVPVSVISAATLVQSNQLRIEDYYSQVPGLTTAPQAESTQVLAIRGIAPSNNVPTVAVMIDDIPVGSSIYTVVPDVDPGDLARIEVLRGPQGTLYGASSLGGLLNFVTLDPSTDRVSGRLEAGVSGTYNGAEPGYNFRGSVNLPLSDNLALRASAFSRQEPGYIDNPTLGVKGINEDHVSGGHLSALWKPTDTLSLKLSAFYQDFKSDGVDDDFGHLTQGYIRGTGLGDRKFQVYGLVLTDKLGPLDLTAISGYNVVSYSDGQDVTPIFSSFAQSQTGVSGYGVYEEANTRKFSQEVRLSAPIGTKLDGLLGFFYTHERSPDSGVDLASDPLTGVVAGNLGGASIPTTYTDYAAFADLTYHLTDRFDVQIGGRESHIRQTYQITYFGPFATQILGEPYFPFITPETKSSASPFTYLLTPRFKISPDLMVYARLASGYHAGGPNAIEPGVPPEFQPDKTYNYEIGSKGEFLDHTLSVDASIYYISWKNIQIEEVGAAFIGYTANGSNAKSQGAELSVESKPIAGLKIAGWIAFCEAVLTQDIPAAAVAAGSYGKAGDRLAFSPRFSSNLAVDEEFPLLSQITGFAGASVSYQGERSQGLAPPGAAPNLPAYAKTDFRAGVKYSDWTTTLYVNNVTDRRARITGAGQFYPNDYTEIRPRTIGLSVSRTF